MLIRRAYEKTWQLKSNMMCYYTQCLFNGYTSLVWWLEMKQSGCNEKYINSSIRDRLEFPSFTSCNNGRGEDVHPVYTILRNNGGEDWKKITNTFNV